MPWNKNIKLLSRTSESSFVIVLRYILFKAVDQAVKELFILYLHMSIRLLKLFLQNQDHAKCSTMFWWGFRCYCAVICRIWHYIGLSYRDKSDLIWNNPWSNVWCYSPCRCLRRIKTQIRTLLWVTRSSLTSTTAPTTSILTVTADWCSWHAGLTMNSSSATTSLSERQTAETLPSAVMSVSPWLLPTQTTTHLISAKRSTRPSSVSWLPGITLWHVFRRRTLTSVMLIGWGEKKIFRKFAFLVCVSCLVFSL